MAAAQMTPPPESPHRLSFEDGGLPDRARERLQEAAGDGPGFFTTTFSVAEMAVARLAGYEPIGQVMGSSVYHVGWGGLLAADVGELTTVTHARWDASTRALGRMAEEARLLGAHAVVGVRLGMRGYEWAGELSEFTAVGTAVRVNGPVPERPALSNLSVQELYKLELAGLWPIDVVMGNSAWRDMHADCRADGRWLNMELPLHTACIDNARSAAQERFKKAIVRANAHGVVAVTVERRFHESEWEANNSSHTEFKAEVVLLGTAVARLREPRLPRPRLVLDLAGGKRVDLGARAGRAEATIKTTEND
jgi:uncharacterized protein YbjQ (UPF0145 family)